MIPKQGHGTSEEEYEAQSVLTRDSLANLGSRDLYKDLPELQEE